MLRRLLRMLRRLLLDGEVIGKAAAARLQVKGKSMYWGYGPMVASWFVAALIAFSWERAART